MENENPAPTTRQLFACWFTFCRAVSGIGQNYGRVDPLIEAHEGIKYADELMKQESR